MSENSKIRYCTKCGATIYDGYAFCTNCGTKINIQETNQPLSTKKEEVFDDAIFSIAKVNKTSVTSKQTNDNNNKKEFYLSCAIFVISLFLMQILFNSPFAFTSFMYKSNYSTFTSYESFNLFSIIAIVVEPFSDIVISPDSFLINLIRYNFYTEALIVCIIYFVFVISISVLIISSLIAIILNLIKRKRQNNVAKDCLYLPHRTLIFILCMMPLFSIAILNFSCWGNGDILKNTTILDYGISFDFYKFLLFVLTATILLSIRARKFNILKTKREVSLKKPLICLVLALTLMLNLNLPLFNLSFAKFMRTSVQTETIGFSLFTFVGSFSTTTHAYYSYTTPQALNMFNSAINSLFYGYSTNGANSEILDLLTFGIGKIYTSPQYTTLTFLTYAISFFLGLVVYYSLQEIFYGKKYYNKSLFSRIILFLLYTVQLVITIILVININSVIGFNNLANSVKSELSFFVIMNIIIITASLGIYKTKPTKDSLKSSYDNSDVSYAPYVIK